MEKYHSLSKRRAGTAKPRVGQCAAVRRFSRDYSSGNRLNRLPALTLNILGQAAALAAIIMAALVSGACLVGNDDFDKARLERDKYRDELVRLHESNDILKRDVSTAYESCDLINTQLTVMAAMSIHDRYTSNLGRPVLPPPLPAAAATQPTNRSTRTQRAVRGEQQSGQQGTAGRTGSRQTSGSGGRTGSSGSGGGTRTAPPSTPPANSGGGGSIDWGF